MKRPFLLPALALATMMAVACDHPFQTHPYDVQIGGEHGINATAMTALEAALADRDTLRVAFVSDTHGWYTDARDEVAHLNTRSDVDFVVHCGDLTDTGTSLEFRWAREIFGALKCPYVALIGNHDFLGTGDQAYKYMYGTLDFSFIVGRTKFVCLNTNATEYDYMAAVPNFDYMEYEIGADSARFDRTVVVMHAPPFSDQFNNNVRRAFRRYLDFFPGLLCCVYGHNHNDVVSDLYDDGLLFWGIDCAKHRNYRIMTITPSGYEMEQIFF